MVMRAWSESLFILQGQGFLACCGYLLKILQQQQLCTRAFQCPYFQVLLFLTMALHLFHMCLRNLWSQSSSNLSPTLFIILKQTVRPKAQCRPPRTPYRVQLEENDQGGLPSFSPFRMSLHERQQESGLLSKKWSNTAMAPLTAAIQSLA